MKSAKSIIPALLLISLFSSQPAYSWNCSVDLDGPTWVKIGRTIDLTASGLPDSGYYSWSATPNLIPNGSTATLTGFLPTYSNYIRVIVRYTTAEGHSCSNTKWVYAHPCEVWINGPAEAQIGEQISLEAATDCDSGGSFSWQSLPGLVADGATAIYTPQAPGIQEITATYTPPEGPSSPDTHTLTVKGCTVSIAGPSEMELGETVSLSATTYPEEGDTYSWNGPTDLTAGLPSNTATFVPAAAGEAQITVDSTAPDGTACTPAIHTITVKEECIVTISGPPAVALGETISLQGEATPAGGYFTWVQAPGLISGNTDAVFAGETTGTSAAQLKYTTAEGGECTPATHNIDVYKVGSITGPYCASSGDTVPKERYIISTNPGGYEDKVTVDPEVLSILLGQTADVTVTGSVAQNVTVDDATIDVLVVNEDVKTTLKIEFTIPDDIITPLQELGVAEHVEFSTSNSYSANLECCGSAIATSKSGATDVTLTYSKLPIPIAGIPLPARIEKYAKAEITLNLSGSVISDIQGNYNGCEEAMVWSGGGSVTLGVALNGGVKAEMPGVFIIGGEAEGSTSITEKMQTINGTKLELSTDWSGLIGKIAGTIEVPKFLFKTGFDKSKRYLQADGILPFEIELPRLN